MRLEHAFPRLIDRPLGIHQHAIEIKQDRTIIHAGEMPRVRPLCKPDVAQEGSHSKIAYTDRNRNMPLAMAALAP